MLREYVQNVICWRILWAWGIIVSFQLALFIAISIFWTLCPWVWSGFCTDGAIWSPSTHFLCFILGWLVYHHVGDSCYLWWGPFFCFFHFNEYGHWGFIRGIGHDALATNKLVEASMVFGYGVSSLVCGAVAVVVALGYYALGGCHHWGWRGLLLLGTLLLGDWEFHEFYFGPDYIQLLELGLD